MQAENIISANSDYKFGNSAAAHTNAYLSPVIVALGKEFKAARILDLGCGNGALAKDLTTADFIVVGCDPSESGIHYARQAVPKAKFYQLGVYDDPGVIAEIDFDMVVSTEVVEHLFYPRYLPHFAAAKLKPGGILVLSTPYHGYIKNVGLSLSNKWDCHHTALWDGGHVKFWSRKTLTLLLEEEGFRFEKFIGCGRVPYLWKSMVIVGRKVG